MSPPLQQQPASVVASLDHLVVAASSLDEGVAWCRKTLGIEPGPGGKHPLMGTHNRLFKIATDSHPQAYFEIIAIDPQAVAPSRPRWFGLDAGGLQARLRDQGPQLIHFVAAATGLAVQRQDLLALGMDMGEVLEVSRPLPGAAPDGLLRWQMLVRPDGQTLCGGAMPTLIDWGAARHPTLQMPDSGVRLRSLRLQGLPAAVAAHLGLPGIETTASPANATSPAAGLQVALDTPLGQVVLRSNG